jgi:hypothetical protein
MKADVGRVYAVAGVTSPLHQQPTTRMGRECNRLWVLKNSLPRKSPESAAVALQHHSLRSAMI